MGAKSISQKVFHVLAILAMTFAVSLLWGGAQAYAVPYVERHWDNSQARVVSETKDCASYSTITDDTTTISGWYVVSGDSSFKDYRLVVEGEAHIILCDGAKLYLEEGINVSSGNRLFIYGQAGDSGQLHCDADTNDNAAIGSDDGQGACGDVTIHGGKVKADTANMGTNGAGIGGGDEGYGGTVKIFGGTVEAIGGYLGAGIGGGDRDGDKGGHGGYTYIYGGNVTATGGTNAAGIGGGELGESGYIKIFGGSVSAYGGSGGAGIGTGYNVSEEFNGFRVEITGGTVWATGGSCGAGIGGGDYVRIGKVKIEKATVIARGGSNAPAIGCGGDVGDDYDNDTTGVSFRNCRVTMYPGDEDEWSVKVKTIDFNESGASNANGHLCVEFKHPDSGSGEIALEADRWRTLKGGGNEYTEVKPCTHGYCKYTGTFYANYHSRKCNNCLFEVHREDCKPTAPYKWDWAGDIMSATANCKCACMFTWFDYPAKVVTTEANGKRTSVASVVVNGVTYTDTRELTLSAISPTVSIEGWTYGEAAKKPTVSGNDGNGRVDYQYKARGADDSTYTAAVPTDAGDYTVRASVAGTATHLSGSATADFTIAKAPNNVSVSIENWQAGKAAKTPVVTADAGEAALEYKKRSGIGAYMPFVPKEEGDYTVRATVPETANYLSGSATADFTVVPAEPADYTYSITLSDSVGVNFYLDDRTDDPSKYEVSCGTGEDLKVLEPQATDDGRSRYEVAECAAKEMGDEVHMVVKYDGVVVKEADYSAKGYCDEVIGGNYDEKHKDLCRATLDFGSYAQKEFGYKEDTLANGGTDYFDNATIAVPDYGAYKEDGSNAITGVTLSLVTTAKTQLVARFKTTAANADGFTATVDGQPAELTYENGKLKVVVAGIAAKDLDAKREIVVTDPAGGTYTFRVSPVDYMGLAVSKSSQVGLNRAFYNYHLKAKDFAGPGAVLNSAPSSSLTAASGL